MGEEGKGAADLDRRNVGSRGFCFLKGWERERRVVVVVIDAWHGVTSCSLFFRWLCSAEKAVVRDGCPGRVFVICMHHVRDVKWLQVGE